MATDLENKNFPPIDSAEPEPEKHKWYQWFPPGTPKEEKKLILKTDFFLLSYACMAFFLKYLDQTNISNAYVSGMSEDLKFHKNELSWFNTWFNIGTIIGSIPMTLLAGYFRPRFFLPAMDFMWSLCVLLIYKCNKFNEICALRFLIGLFESSANPSTHFILGCIYRKHELMRRAGFFVISGVIGQATSSYIQSGLYENMNGVGGLAAWRWLFIFDFIIGIPVITWGLIAIPELPHSKHKSWWISHEEKEMLVENLNKDGKVNKKLVFDKSQFKVILTSWQFYAFPIGYALWTLTCCSYMIQFYSLFLKYYHYSIVKVNNIPTAISGVNLIFMISTGIVADKIGRRWPVCLFVGCLLVVATAMLTSSNDARGLRMFAYTLTGVYGCFTPLLSGWCNISCAGNPYLRAVTIPFMIVLGQVVSTPVQQNIFPSGDAPYYKSTNGYAFSLAFSVALTVWCAGILPILDWKLGETGRLKTEESYESEPEVVSVTDGTNSNDIKK